MNKINILLTAFLVGCGTTSIPTSIEDYDEERVAREAKKLGMRPVDYLHYSNNKNLPPLVLYQAYDANWAHDHSIHPVFEAKEEAQKYVDTFNDGHSYIVREVNFRYEVRQVNDLVNDLLYTSRTFNDAYEYVVEYSSSHSDLIIYDLKTGKTFEETP